MPTASSALTIVVPAGTATVTPEAAASTVNVVSFALTAGSTGSGTKRSTTSDPAGQAAVASSAARRSGSGPQQ
ncbi:MAG: hypothetical protein BWY91_02787 [bacterium ADurb.BinA028]|nr:MAG: hypothetical protein BWY91_02787 [bacterium ADurb.BinA028]